MAFLQDKFEMHTDQFNHAGHLMLTCFDDGTVNDAKWFLFIKETLLIGFPDIKDAFDVNQDLPDLPEVDPLEWSILPRPAVLVPRPPFFLPSCYFGVMSTL